MAEAKEHLWECHKCGKMNTRVGINDKCMNDKCGQIRKFNRVIYKYQTRSVSGWTCKICHWDNMKWDRCDSCRRPYNAFDINLLEEWICAFCNVQNPLDMLDNCSRCNKEKTPLGGVTPATEQYWGCKKCTYHNSLQSQNCAMCRTERFKEETQPVLLNKSLARNFSSSMIRESLGQDIIAAFNIIKEIINFCTTEDCVFVDFDFYPVPKNIGDEGRLEEQNLTDITWVRSNSIDSEDDTEDLEWRVYSAPRPSDIIQGKLSDCWLLCALTVLAEREDLLEKIILSKDYSQHGVYQVRLCKDGIWKTVIIDDRLPCNTECKLVFSKAKRRQLWVPLIEKAAAKLYGSYTALESGTTIEAMALLTGQPCEYLPLGDYIGKEDSLWQKVKDAYDQNFLMGASTPDKDSHGLKAKGLCLMHAYSILRVHDLIGHARLLKLRNPWGLANSWSGDWCNKSDKWKNVNDIVKNDLQPDGNQNGTFWICLEDFFKYFVGVEMCKAKEEAQGWHEVRLTGTFPRNAGELWKFVSMIIHEDTELHIGLFQKSLRGQPEVGELLLDILVVVMEDTEDGISPFRKVVAISQREARSFVGCDLILPKGKYTIASMAFIHWDTACSITEPSAETVCRRSDYERKYAVAIHSSKTINRFEVNTSNERYKYALADTIIRLTVDKGTARKVPDYQEVTLYRLDLYGAFFVVENSSKNRYAQVILTISETGGYMNCTRNLEKNNCVVDCVRAGYRQVLLVFTRSQPKMKSHVGKEELFVEMHDEQDKTDEWDGHHEPAIDDPKLKALHTPRKFQ